MADDIKNNELEEEDDIITLIDDDGKEVKCEYIDTVEMNDKVYCVVEPLETKDDMEEGTCFIFNMVENEDGSVDLSPVESDEELEAVFAKFMENCAEGDDCDCCGDEGCDCGCKK